MGGRQELATVPPREEAPAEGIGLHQPPIPGVRPVLPESLTEVLKLHLGHDTFRSGQEELIQAVSGGRDALGILPTGGGKSVCFQLPALLLPGMVLVVSPLISLMEDQLERARQVGLRAEVLNATVPGPRREAIMEAARRSALDMLLVSPERLHLPGFLSALSQFPISLLAVDEAHCISMWGNDFRPSYLRIGEVRGCVPAPILALTATATPRVREEISARLRLQEPLVFVSSFDRPNLYWEVRQADTHRKKMAGIHTALRRRKGASIIYAATRRTVESVRKSLAGRGLPALAYHAGLPADVRSLVQTRFLQDPRPVVVATNAFGMGIDRADVRLVLHYQLPGSLEAYYQEAGRAGRDGQPARCLGFFGDRDANVHQRFIEGAFPPDHRIQRLHAYLRNRASHGVEHWVTMGEMTRALGKRTDPGDALAVLRALARTGAVLAEEVERHGAYPEPSARFSVRVRPQDPNLDALARLRAAELRQLQAVLDYAKVPRCRRKALLSHFGERIDGDRRRRRIGSCGRCDVCGPGAAVGLGGRLLWIRGFLAAMPSRKLK
jgi:ATP-dependent DNA helicase RecQ